MKNVSQICHRHLKLSCKTSRNQFLFLTYFTKNWNDFLQEEAEMEGLIEEQVKQVDQVKIC